MTAGSIAIPQNESTIGGYAIESQSFASRHGDIGKVPPTLGPGTGKPQAEKRQAVQTSTKMGGAFL